MLVTGLSARGHARKSSGETILELVYESRFENADMVTETLVMTLDDDGA